MKIICDTYNANLVFKGFRYMGRFSLTDISPDVDAELVTEKAYARLYYLIGLADSNAVILGCQKFYGTAHKMYALGRIPSIEGCEDYWDYFFEVWGE
jgi:hypothetical protein